jgi:hypothetical protein
VADGLDGMQGASRALRRDGGIARLRHHAQHAAGVGKEGSGTAEDGMRSHAPQLRGLVALFVQTLHRKLITLSFTHQYWF